MLGNIMTFIDFGKYDLSYIFHNMIIYALYEDSGYHLRMHPRHDEDSLETAKNVLAVRLV